MAGRFNSKFKKRASMNTSSAVLGNSSYKTPSSTNNSHNASGRFNSKFKKRTSHNTSNIKTSSSPIVSKPRKVSRPTPVRTTPRGSTLTSNVVNAVSHNPFTIPKAEAYESYDTNTATADEGTKFTQEGYDPNITPPVKGPIDDPNVDGNFTMPGGKEEAVWYNPFSWFGNVDLGEGSDPNYINKEAGAATPGVIPETEVTWNDDELQPRTNLFTDGGDLPHATKNTIANAVISAHFDKDGKKVEEKTVPYSDFAPDGAIIANVKDYVTGEQRKSYYHNSGRVSAEDHQAALDQQAIWQFENSIQSNYFKNITAGNMNDDMFKGLHDKIESSKVPKWKKEELWGEYADKNTNYKSRSTYGGYEGLGSNTTHKTGKVDGVQASNWDFGNTTSWKPNKAETTKAEIDKDILSVSKHDFAKYLVSTGQNTKPGGFDEFYNGTGTGFLDLTKINDKGGKKNKPIWFDYQDLGY